MCESGPYLKFCTCDTSDPSFEEPSEPYSWWTLQIKHTIPSSPIVGSFAPFEESLKRLELTHDEIFSCRYIADQLNQRNLFDFDYSPKQGDALFIELSGGAEVSLCFENGKWKCDERSRLEIEDDERHSFEENDGLCYGSDQKEGYLEIEDIL